MICADASVVIPAYLAAECLPRAVESVLRQTLPPREIIIVENASPDRTMAVAESLRSRYPALVRVATEKRSGAAAARNTGIRLSRSTWVALLDADDTWLPHKLETQFGCIDRRPEVAMVHSACSLTYPDGRVSSEGCAACDGDEWLASFLSRRIGTSSSTVLLRRANVLSIGAFDERLLIAEDADLWIRMAAWFPMAYIPVEVAICPRQHAISTLTRAGASLMRDYDVRAWRKNGGLFVSRPRLRRAWRRGYAILYQLKAAALMRHGQLGSGLIRHLLSGVIDPGALFSYPSRQLIRAWLPGFLLRAILRLRRG